VTSRRDARRIVSLVPSLTEALFALGLGPRVVGVTDWCVHPADAVAGLPKVGGTKNPALARVLELRPDLVLANREENRERDVARLREAGVDVWVTYPRTVAEALALLREVAALGAPEAVASALLAEVEEAFAGARAAAARPPTRVFCPIWKRPWMAVGADTYAHDLLTLCGGENVFAARDERRYPIVEEAEIVAAAPEVVLLPDEPYAFGPHDVEELAALAIPAAGSGRIHCVDGTLISWYGPRTGRALREIGALLAPGASLDPGTGRPGPAGQGAPD
jgi:ABC-type Fe3+-hydroxamate transport system substrate-binding protein